MSVGCRQAAHISLAVLGRRADQAQCLALEVHLADCTRCTEEHTDAMVVARGLAACEPAPLPAGAREAVRRAFARAPIARASQASFAWWKGLPAKLSLASVAAFAVALVLSVHFRSAGDPPYRVLSGEVAVLETVDDHVRLHSAQGGQLRVKEADVILSAATEVDWRNQPRRLDLRHGEVLVDVTHRPGQHFEVRTDRFTVHVLGTRFRVSETSVHTERGLVRVFDAQGHVAAQLEAGQSWTLPAGPAEQTSARQIPSTATDAPIAAARVAVTSIARGATTRAHHSPPPAFSVATVLGDARRSLAHGDASAARRIVAPLFRLGHDGGVEARVLFAESFLVEGRYADAIDAYRVVARDFPRTSQAETAAFAIAQLNSEHGRPSEARVALQDYLDRYPRGRFVHEAAARLARLSARDR